MSKWSRLLGIIGAVFLLFGIVGALIIGSFAQPLILMHLLVGLVFVVLMAVGQASSGGLSADGARSLLTSRSARFGLNAGLATTVFAVFLVALNWTVNRHDRRWDLTQEGVFSVSDQSVKVVEALTKQLKIVAFKVGDGEQEQKTKELLELYKYHNPSKVSTSLIDPRSNPGAVDTYQMKGGNVVYLEYGEGETKGTSRLNEVSEQTLTNAIIKLTRGEARRVYYVQGHDEPDIQGQDASGLKGFAEAVADEHLTMEGLVLAQKEKIPDNAAAVLLISPKKPLLPVERELLTKYVDAGGRLLMMTDPKTTTDVQQIAQYYGIKVGTDVIIDKVQRLFAGPTLGAQPMVQTYGTHPITRNFTANSVTIFNIASSVTSGEKIKDASYSDLAKTGPSAWGETNVALVFAPEAPTAVYEQGDLAGPVGLAVAYEKKITLPAKADSTKDAGQTEQAKFDQIARVVVFGDSDWILNANLDVYSNRDFALNAVNWLAGEEGGIAVRPKAIKKSQMEPLQAGTFALILASSFIIPELILIFGLFVWWKRRTVEA